MVLCSKGCPPFSSWPKLVPDCPVITAFAGGSKLLAHTCLALPPLANLPLPSCTPDTCPSAEIVTKPRHPDPAVRLMLCAPARPPPHPLPPAAADLPYPARPRRARLLLRPQAAWPWGAGGGALPAQVGRHGSRGAAHTVVGSHYAIRKRGATGWTGRLAPGCGIEEVKRRSHSLPRLRRCSLGRHWTCKSVQPSCAHLLPQSPVRHS